MAEHVAPFSLQQIGTAMVRFPSGVPIPTMSDEATDPYARTRPPTHVFVEGLQFWPQQKGTYPGVLVLHEWWGLNAQIKDLANRLACEGYVVLVPNLYTRQGGMVTANTEVAAALMSRNNEAGLLQDLNSCCEFLNTRDAVKRNVYGVVGFGMGGTLALRFACQRKRLRGAVSFYGKMISPPDLLKDLSCPVLYHRADADDWVAAHEVEQLRDTATAYGKQVTIKVYDAPHAFCNETRQETYRPEAAREAWDATVAFLNDCFR